MITLKSNIEYLEYLKAWLEYHNFYPLIPSDSTPIEHMNYAIESLKIQRIENDNS